MSVREPTDGYLSPAEAKRFYDRLGSAQDWQGFYENPAINELIAHAAFDSAHSAFDPQRTAFPALIRPPVVKAPASSVTSVTLI